jgi:hypothetical protein
MDVLKAIHRLVKNLKPDGNQPEDCKPDTGESSKTDQFISLLIDPEMKYDDQVSWKIYGTLGSDEYRTLKKRVKSKLLNQLFQINVSENEKIEARKKHIFENSRNMHAVKLLLMMGERNAAAELAASSLKSAIENQNFDGVVYFASRLRYHYSLTGDKKEFEIYNKILNQYLEIQKDTFNAEEMAISFQMEFMRSRHRKPALSKLAHQNADQIGELLNKHQTFETGIDYFRLRNQAYQNEAKYEESEKVLVEWLGFLDKNKKLAWRSLYAEIYLNRINNALYLSRFEQGFENISLCSKMVTEGDYNWFVMKDLEFLHFMHSRQFKEADNLVNTIITHKNFTSINKVRQEKWRIYEAYSTFINELTPAQNTKNNKIERKAVDPVIFSSDKKGMHVNLLILNALYSLIFNYDAYLEDKQEALEQYYLRHLKNKENSRSKIFLQMLISVSKINSENIEKMLRITNKQFQKLKNLSYSFDSGMELQEIIPYEILWPKLEDAARKRVAEMVDGELVNGDM